MFSRENAQKSQKRDWWDIPFIDYLNAVDDALELLRGHASEQGELGVIAEAQENGDTPRQIAERANELRGL